MALDLAAKASGINFIYIRQVLRLRIPLAIATMGLAGIGLLASWANVDAALRPLDGGASTHPITALCLLGIGFAVFRLKRFGRTPVWRFVLGGMILMVCAARLMEGIVGYWTGAALSDAFGPVFGFQGRFSVESAVTLGAFAMAGMLRQRLPWFGMGFLIAGITMIYTTLVELSYGLTLFAGDISGVSLLGLICAALAMVTVYVHRPFVRVLLLIGDIGSQTRVMATVAVVVPWLIGFFLTRFDLTTAASAPLAAAMMSAMTWAMLVILMTTSARLEGSDAARRRAEREIAMMSRIDPLTKALNRFGMTEVLEGAWLQFRSLGGTFGTILIDLDYFTRLNETFGHDAGDDVLERVSATLYPHLRTSDALGRWGGGEFLILLKVRDRADLGIVAERLRAALEDVQSPFCQGLDGEPSAISASFGISDMREDDEGPGDAITRADLGLFQAKEDGRNRVVSHYIEDKSVAA